MSGFHSCLLLVWESVLTCKWRKGLSFSSENLRTWSNLYIWEERGEIVHSIPELSDGTLKVTSLSSKKQVCFMVSWKEDFPKEMAFCGSHVNSRTRTTTDPLELKELLSVSPNGLRLFEDLKHAFPKSSLVRLES